MTMSLYFNLSFRLRLKPESDTRANLVQIRSKNVFIYSDFFFYLCFIISDTIVSVSELSSQISLIFRWQGIVAKKEMASE